MTPKPVTTINGGKRWACTSCGVSSINKWTAMVCCTSGEEETNMNDLPCDTEPQDSSLTNAEMLEKWAGAQSAEPNPPVKAPELLGRAAAHMHERGKTYDAPEGERSMGKTVAAFNAITGRDLTESEGWLFMTTLKAVRGFTRGGYHADSFEDLIAYTALLAEAKGEGR